MKKIFNTLDNTNTVANGRVALIVLSMTCEIAEIVEGTEDEINAYSKTFEVVGEDTAAEYLENLDRDCANPEHERAILAGCGVSADMIDRVLYF